MKKILLILAAGVVVICRARSTVILDDSFDYPDGALTAVSAGTWVSHSGTLNQVDVTSGRVNLSQKESEDVNAQLAGAPYEGPTLYASFLVNFSALPAGAGTYFAHFKNATATGIRCRIFATTTGAATGRFRLGIANGSGAPVDVATDLTLNTDYLLVARYNSGTPASTIWISPASESDTANRADATDSATAISITSFALRQAGLDPGMGVLTFDNLKVGTAFSEVASSHYQLQIQADRSGVAISWPIAAADYRLQSKMTLDAGDWSDVSEIPAPQGDRLIVRYPSLLGSQFFRLVKP